MPDPLQVVVHLRVHVLPVSAREAEDGVVAAHPALHAVVQVEGRFGFAAEVAEGGEEGGGLKGWFVVVGCHGFRWLMNAYVMLVVCSRDYIYV